MGLSQLLEFRCPRCSQLTPVRVCGSMANRLRISANALLIIVFGFPLFLLVRKCLECGVYFRGKTAWSRPGECIECGYVLIGNESGVCPECGRRCTPPPQLS